MKATTVPENGVIRPSDIRVSGRTLDQFRANLKVGDLIRGRVVGRFDNNKALVNFRGFNIITEMVTVPNRGEVIEARIISVGDQIAMRVIPTTPTGVNSSTTIADLLSTLDLPITGQTQAMVKALIHHNLPLTRENVESLIQYAALFDGDANVPMDLVALSWLLDLPPNSHLFDALRLLFGDRERLGTQLQKVRTLLVGLLTDMPDGMDATLVQNLLQLIEHTTQEDFSSQIQRFMAQLGLGYEAQLFAAVGDATLLREFLQRSHGNLKGALLRLRSQILMRQRESNLPEPLQQRLAPVMEALDGILTTIDAHEIAVNHKLANGNQFYLQIPYWLGNQPGTAEILAKSSGSGPNRRLDPESMQLELRIETVHLGTVKIHLHTLQRQMNATILTENSQYCDFIQMYKGDLLSRMRALNYDIKDLGLRVAAPDDLRLEPISLSPVLEGELAQIDATA
ncbi:MAG: hypothetical protein O7E52_19355 [Candidatus Poribacteria bacterium]|nr:hypothetical protein [Candidatus Poribacteria bacterium]